MKLSIVTTLYCSEKYVAEFYRRATQAAIELTNDYEIIFVNDGSPDGSLREALEVWKQDSRVTVIDFARNFGHHKAIMTGLEHSRGEHVFLIDSDLEEAPELIGMFYRQLASSDADVVYGVQAKRKGGLFEKLSGWLFYRLFSVMAGIELPKDVLTARLMTRRYVKALVSHREREIFLAGLWYVTGFEQTGVVVEKASTSETTYNLRRKIDLLVNSVTSFSNAPLVFIFNLGLLISITSGVYTGYLVFNWIFLSRPLVGWTSVMASIWLIGGLIISFVGVIGIYLSKIFSETKQRPYVIVREIYGPKAR